MVVVFDIGRGKGRWEGEGKMLSLGTKGAREGRGVYDW
jgi:hypothetical protein